MPLRSPAASPVSEPRRRARARCLRRARCVFNGGASTLDVLVRNISGAGARIVGNELICLPPTFELRIIDANGDVETGYSSRKARVVWRTEAAAGIEFLD